MKLLYYTFLLTFFFSLNGFSQQQIGSEIGIEGYFGASNLGGNYGLDLKYGRRINEYIVVGPSFRLMHGWSNTLGVNYAYNIYGGGLYAHARYGNMVFGGIDFEMLKTPFNNTFVSTTKTWVPTLFVGGGFSREFKEIIRVNAGIFYDAINHQNSPFRSSYTVTKTDPATGKISGYIPVIYRITFFFNLGNKKDDNQEEEEE